MSSIWALAGSVAHPSAASGVETARQMRGYNASGSHRRQGVAGTMRGRAVIATEGF